MPASTRPEERRAAGLAIRALQDRIRQGELGPGERLPSERALSETLGVSRPTIREAVQALSAMNVLEARHGSGTYVSSLAVERLLEPLEFALELSAPTVRSLFEVRLALEPLAAELAAARATPQQHAVLRECLRLTEKPRLTRKALLELDVQLHELVVEAADNDLLRTISRSMNILGRKSRELTVKRPEAIIRAVAAHRTIVEAILARDGDAARKAMTEHLTSVYQALASDA
jgi:DNA-binding FadR family transcriptional regulator